MNNTITPFKRFRRFQTRLLFPGDNSKNFGSSEDTTSFSRWYCLRENRIIGEYPRLTRLEMFDILPVTYLVMQRVLDYRDVLKHFGWAFFVLYLFRCRVSSAALMHS